MSTRGSKRPLKAYARDPRRRKVLFGVDLNDAPPCDSREVEGANSSNDSQYAQAGAPPSNGRLWSVEMGGTSLSNDLRYSQMSAPLSDGLFRSTPIDVEALEDELIISSPRSFAAARNQSRRRNNDRNHNMNAVTVVLDDDLDAHQGIIGDEPVTRLTLNGYSNQGRKLEKSPTHNVSINVEQQLPVMPKEPVFTCAICMGPLVEEHTTICGHIFCKKCIKAAIAAQKKCPTCRRNLRANNIHRVYLPSIN
ncbi:E3 ubiquitin-protein ligase complex slx8-rfp subunit slx8-like isoform X2 [Aristolochia californica]|uniref:E3 ubiquitin-protein ligase complex slx8-rfp subunit slx8-like isoform X2 n=1 Tax=Aristolochia californica TaxID=171875 RepID=UPI0035E11C88